MNTELIEQLRKVLPGLENSSSTAEDAMIRLTPKIIVALLRADLMEIALEAIRDRHVPDQPAANDVPEEEYVRQNYMVLRLIARAALKAEAV